MPGLGHVMRAAWAMALVALAGCTGPSDPGVALRMEERVVHASAPGPDVPIIVPTGAFALNATVTAASEVDLSIALLSPAGDIVASGAQERPGRWSLATVAPPGSGNWSLSVATRPGQHATYEARLTILLDKPGVANFARSVRVNESIEANLVLDAGDHIEYSFDAGNATAAWALHSHRGDGVVTWAAGNETHASGSFDAPARDTYSLLVSAHEVTLHIEGAFRVASVVER